MANVKRTLTKDKTTGKMRNKSEVVGLTPEQKEVGVKLKAQKKITIKLEATGKKRTILLNGTEVTSYGDPESYGINGYISWVPRGVMVEVPEAIAQLIKGNEETVEYYDDELQRHLPHGSREVIEYISG